MYTEIYGNLIKLAKNDTFDLVTHGCNCKKNFGKGIALQFKQQYPEMYENDLNTPSTMGTITWCNAKHQPNLILVNSYTQVYPGKSKGGMDSEFHRYEAIKNSMKKINQEFKGKHLGIPKIGCGYAGLEWRKVKSILKEELVDLNVTIVIFE